jgi:hypothetical protein
MTATLQGITQDEFIAEQYAQATRLTQTIERLKGEAQYAREQGNLERMASYLYMVADYSHDLGLALGILIGLGKSTSLK